MRGFLLAVGFLVATPFASSAQTPDPLRFLPPIADLIIKINYRHGEGHEPVHLTGTAIRYRSSDLFQTGMH